MNRQEFISKFGYDGFGAYEFTPMIDTTSQSDPGIATIKLGSTGEVVKKWQRIIGVFPSGNFNADTDMMTKKWQKEHNLTADGVVGKGTWGIALGTSAPKAKSTYVSKTSYTPSQETLQTYKTDTSEEHLKKAGIIAVIAGGVIAVTAALVKIFQR